MGAERFRAPEILFHPELVGEEYPGIHECLATSIVRTDLDLRKTLYSNIILAGGSTLFPGKTIEIHIFSILSFQMIRDSYKFLTNSSESSFLQNSISMNQNLEKSI